MNPEKARARLVGFLLKKTELHNRLLIKLAKEDLKNISYSIGENKTLFSQEDIKKYIAANYNVLSKKAKNNIDKICKELLPERHWVYLAKQFSVLSIILIPPISSLCIYFAELVFNAEKNYSAIGLCLFSILMLFTSIVVSIFYFIMKK